MTKFEEVGVSRQQDSRTVSEAVRNMSVSCQACCLRGLRLECDRCAIKTAHEITLAALHDVEVSHHQMIASACQTHKGFTSGGNLYA